MDESIEKQTILSQRHQVCKEFLISNSTGIFRSLAEHSTACGQKKTAALPQNVPFGNSYQESDLSQFVANISISLTYFSMHIINSGSLEKLPLLQFELDRSADFYNQNFEGKKVKLVESVRLTLAILVRKEDFGYSTCFVEIDLLGFA
jgi:hypothetical protein